MATHPSTNLDQNRRTFTDQDKCTTTKRQCHLNFDGVVWKQVAHLETQHNQQRKLTYIVNEQIHPQQ